MPYTKADTDTLAHEHGLLLRRYAALQQRCTEQARAQAQAIARLQAQVMGLRAQTIVQCSARAWADEDSLIETPPPADLARLEHSLRAADLVVVASPTYKGTYTGLVKLFLDRFAGGTGLRGVAVPLMLGASPSHALAPELSLRPVLTEIGATVPGRGLFVVDADHDDPAAYSSWLAATRPVVAALRAERSVGA